MVTDATGQVAEVLHVPNRASQGTTGGRTMPLPPDLQAALVLLQRARGDLATPARPLLFSARGGGVGRARMTKSNRRHGRSPRMQALRSMAERPQPLQRHR